MKLITALCSRDWPEKTSSRIIRLSSLREIQIHCHLEETCYVLLCIEDATACVYVCIEQSLVIISTVFSFLFVLAIRHMTHTDREREFEIV